MASAYALCLTVFIYRELGLKDIVRVVREVCVETASIMLVVSASTLYGYMITKCQIPQMVLDLFLSISDNKAVFLLLINLFLLFVGCFMETNAAIMILTPILLPAAVTLALIRCIFGLIMVFNLMIGLLTPRLACACMPRRGLQISALRKLSRVRLRSISL